MPDNSASPVYTSPIPPDNQQRQLAAVNPDSHQQARHIVVVGDTYTLLLTGKDTAGRFCLIDMYVPPGGGPPPHRHDFEETFTLLEGELDFVFRGTKRVARAGDTIHVPANAPHQFRNASSHPRACFASAHPLVRKTSSSRSVSPSPPAPPHRRSGMRKPKPSSSPRSWPSLRNIVPSSCPTPEHLPGVHPRRHAGYSFAHFPSPN